MKNIGLDGGVLNKIQLRLMIDLVGIKLGGANLDLKISTETNHKILTARDFRCTIKFIDINKYPKLLAKGGLGYLAIKDYIVKAIKEKKYKQ